MEMRPVPGAAEGAAEAEAVPATRGARRSGKIVAPAFIAILSMLALISFGVHYLDARSTSCESLPMPQLRVNGITYLMSNQDPSQLGRADLGPPVGTVVEGLPDDASRCRDYILRDGQGTPTPGTDVLSIIGVDPHLSVATFEQFQITRYDAVIETSSTETS
ncbi:MAG: hypothetical protein U0Q03_11285 [Acidimicrobiales bacterium]